MHRVVGPSFLTYHAHGAAGLDDGGLVTGCLAGNNHDGVRWGLFQGLGRHKGENGAGSVGYHRDRHKADAVV